MLPTGRKNRQNPKRPDFFMAFRLTHVKNPFNFRTSVFDGQNWFDGLIFAV